MATGTYSVCYDILINEGIRRDGKQALTYGRIRNMQHWGLGHLDSVGHLSGIVRAERPLDLGILLGHEG